MGLSICEAGMATDRHLVSYHYRDEIKIRRTSNVSVPLVLDSRGKCDATIRYVTT